VQLIVAEKPSVARDLSRVLGVRPAGRNCFEGPRCVITWCIGHLVELDEPAAYDGRWKAWRLDSLPMLPAEFRLRPAKHAAEQLRAVARLLRDRRFTQVINACDAGREGELIFRYVYQFAGGGPPIQRLWISSLTDDAIRRGFAALRPGTQLDALADAARSRSEADWLVGMNATRGITVRGRESGHDALFSIGRVQTPTLAMLVERERAITEFVPRDYWEIRGDFATAAGEPFSAIWRIDPARAAAGPSNDRLRAAAGASDRDTARVGSVEIARAIVARDAEHGGAADPIGPRVERLRARIEREPPPLLFDLTSLQRTANRRFGWSAARTLELAQALYERHKLVTYPRTDARHLTTDVARDLPRMFAALAGVPDYAAFASELIARPPRPTRRVVDDAKVHDHHAIVPTGNAIRLDALDRDEHRLFDLVARRFLGAFFPDAEFAVTEAWIRVLAADGSPPPFPSEARGPGRDERGGAVSNPARGPGRDERVGAAADPARGEAPASEPRIVDALPPAPDRYLARGRVRKVAGWQAVAGIDATSAARRAGARADGDGDADDSSRRSGAAEGATNRRFSAAGAADDATQAILPALVEGQPLDGSFATVARQTRPPPRYTEATLLSAMESAGKVIDDEALREAMKDCGLGTPATRAAIIETLLRRAYIVRDKQQLVPTAIGIGLIAALPVASLASPELTGAWEARLARIARGQDTRAAFMADITRYVADLVDAIRTADPPPPPPAGAPAQARPRGRFGRGPRRSRIASRGPGRRAPAPREQAAPRAQADAREQGAPLRAPYRARAARTARSREADVRSPATSAPRTSAGAPRTSAGAPRTSARAPRTPRTSSESRPAINIEALGCPRCRSGTLITGARGWGCSRWRDGCRFVVWFETFGRRLTLAQLRDLVTRGRTRKARFGARTGSVILDGDTVRFEAADAVTTSPSSQ
jgi:DNA topoisomerase III